MFQPKPILRIPLTPPTTSPTRPSRRSMTLAIGLGISFGALVACGGDSDSGDDGNNNNRPDAGTPSPDAQNGSNDGVLPPLRPQSGVAYVAHFLSSELRSVRTDTAMPEAGPSLDLGAETHDMVIDAENDRLAVVNDVARRVRLFDIERPASAGAPIAAPTPRGTITFAPTKAPRFAAFNPFRDRLYVLASDTEQNPLVTMELHAIDVSNPDDPRRLIGWPKTVPVTVSFAVDPVRDVLFLIELTTDILTGYDLSQDGFEPLPGGVIDLLAQFPQENQNAFQPRSLIADYRRNRLYAAREQSALSELIVIDYPADIPTGDASFSDFASMSDLSFVDDGFDVDQPLDERPNLLGAFVTAVDEENGAVFMSSNAWNGSASMAAVTAFNPDASLSPSCNDVPGEGFGCFLRGYLNGDPVSYKRTDGAMCVDSTHQRVVATAIGGDGSDPGSVHVFSYDRTNLATMSAQLPAGGGNLTVSLLPIAAVCH